MTVGELRRLPGWVAQYTRPNGDLKYWSSNKKWFTNVVNDITVYKTKKEASEVIKGQGTRCKAVRTSEV